jgi:hypothetical protein
MLAVVGGGGGGESRACKTGAAPIRPAGVRAALCVWFALLVSRCAN